MSPVSLGDQELVLLRWVAEHGPATVGEAVERFGEPNGLSRSTVVTVLERLRKKGYLARERDDNANGVFRYAAGQEQTEVLGGLVQRFVENTLAGSLAPFAAYFSRSGRLTPDETVELERLLAKLEPARSGNEEENSR